jgi:hypothetical protein
LEKPEVTGSLSGESVCCRITEMPWFAWKTWTEWAVCAGTWSRCRAHWRVSRFFGLLRQAASLQNFNIHYFAFEDAFLVNSIFDTRWQSPGSRIVIDWNSAFFEPLKPFTVQSHDSRCHHQKQLLTFQKHRHLFSEVWCKTWFTRAVPSFPTLSAARNATRHRYTFQYSVPWG